MATKHILDDYHTQVKDVVNLGFKSLDHFTSMQIEIGTNGDAIFKIYSPETAWIVGSTFPDALDKFKTEINFYLTSIGKSIVDFNPDKEIILDLDLCPPGIMAEDESEPEILFMLPIDPDHLRGNVYQP